MIEGVTREFNSAYQDPGQPDGELAAELFLSGMEMTFNQHHAEDTDELRISLPYEAGRATVQLMRRHQQIRINLPPVSGHNPRTHLYARHTPPHAGVHRVDSVPHPEQLVPPRLREYPGNMIGHLAAMDYIIFATTAGSYRAGHNNRPVEPEEVRDLFMWLTDAKP